MLGFLDAAAVRAARRFAQHALGGDRRFLVLLAAALAAHLALRPERTKVVTEELRLGEGLLVRHVPPPPTRHERRKRRRAEKRAAVERVEA